MRSLGKGRIRLDVGVVSLTCFKLKRMFLKSLQELVPSLTMDDIRQGRSGVRAMLLNTDGDTRDDFRIEATDRSIHVLNAPSPAATASLAIGDYVADRYGDRFAK